MVPDFIAKTYGAAVAGYPETALKALIIALTTGAATALNALLLAYVFLLAGLS